MISALLTSSVLILVILLLRKMLRGKVGNGFLYALWLVVAVRLLMPAPEFLLEKVAGIEKPWIGSSVSVMNLAAGLASYWENDRTGQPEELPRYSGEEAENTSAREPEKLSGEKTEDYLLEKSEAKKGAVWQAEKETEEQNTGMSQTDAMSGEKPEIQEVEICNKKFGGGGGSLLNFLQAPWRT